MFYYEKTNNINEKEFDITFLYDELQRGCPNPKDRNINFYFKF